MDREKFFAKRDLEIYTFQVDGLGECRMRQLTESERVNGYDMWLRPDGKFSEKRAKDCRIKTIVLCLLGPDDKPFLTDADIPKIRNEFPSATISQLAQVAMKCMGLGEDDMLDKVEKKSEGSAPAHGE